MLPVISIVGRPNVGKSTLFNRLTRTRDALVNNTPGVTRDRLYGVASFDGCISLVVDTGGIGETDDFISQKIFEQVRSVLEESSVVLFLVDAVEGLTVVDEQIAQKLNQFNVPIFIGVNKSEGLAPEMACLEFLALGFSEPIPISARRGSGVQNLINLLVQSLPKQEDPLWEDPGPKIAVVGRPNVGKSTLVNSICGDQRLIVTDVPGTTRDSVVVPYEYKNERYRLIDTAGVRRRSKVGYSLEKLSVVKTLQAIEAAHVAVLVLDGSEAITDQDANLAGIIRKSGRPVVMVVNKSDKIKPRQRSDVNLNLRRKLAFAQHHEAFYVSGLKKIGLAKLMSAIAKAYQSSMIEMPTSVLNQYLEEAVMRTPPPMSKRRPVKLKYAHQGGKNPPVVVIHGNNVNSVAEHYRRYLEKFFRKKFRLFGAEVKVVFRASQNPYGRSAH